MGPSKRSLDDSAAARAANGATGCRRERRWPCWRRCRAPGTGRRRRSRSGRRARRERRDVDPAHDLRRHYRPGTPVGSSSARTRGHLRLASGNGEYLLRVDSGPSTLTLHVGVITQKLISISMTEHDAATWQLLWAGDLDGDGKLDLLFDLSTHSGAGARRLFLSSAARKGEAVREVAVLETTGC
jgi:hypothetical protein